MFLFRRIIIFSCFFLITLESIYTLEAKEICSRVATINYQEILVDLSNSQKGDGLKFYLNQDKIASKYLKKYQENSRKRTKYAVIGSLGASFAILSVFSKSSAKKHLFLEASGITFILNYLIAKILDIENEKNLDHSIYEYNKRNIPKIYMSTDRKDKSDKIYIEKSWNF